MSGNVSEWTYDTYDAWPVSDGRIVRGGGYSDNTAKLRSARLLLSPGTRTEVTGFRLVKQASASVAKALYDFELRTTENSGLSEDVSATIEATIISLTVPFGTSVSGLIAGFSVSAGATVRVGDIVQESAVTANDFSGPVEYMVTADDGSQLSYTVIVSVQAN